MNDMTERSNLSLMGQVAIVTGGGTGIGKSIATEFTKAGADVVIAGRRDNVLQLAAEELSSYGRRVIPIQTDVSKRKDVEHLIERTVSELGSVDILVNNVGILAPGNVVDVDEADWNRVIDTNLKSMMLTSKYAVPQMIDGGGGAIINLTSFMALRGGYASEPVAYSASKGGVTALTTAMASEHGRDNIRVNAIAPGYLHTPMVAATMTKELRELRRRSAPLGTEGTAWDVGWAAIYLASDEARWVTGVTLPVDAGILATSPLAMHHRM